MSALRVAVPRELFTADPGSGAGRVWTTVLAILGGRGVLIEPRDPARGRRFLRRRGGADVWLTHGAGGPLDVPEPVVAVIHGAAWPIESSFFDYVPHAYAEPMIAITEATIGSASELIVPSAYTQRGVIEGYGLGVDRVNVVPHGVDLETFNPSSHGGMDLVAAAFGRRLPYVLFASIPSIQQKNLKALRAAMGRLAARGLPHGLVIAGGTAGGESPDELAAIVAEIPGTSDRVAWLGHLGDEQLAALMAGCAAFCLPSLFESFGLTALEALASGAPTVVSSRGALPEVVADGALVVDPTPSELADALARLLERPEEAARLRMAGRSRAESLSWARTADGWQAVLERSAGRRSSS